MNSDFGTDCIRCGSEAGPFVCNDGYRMCGHCFWICQCEDHELMTDVVRYLRAWADFRAWEADHGRLAA